MKNDNTSTNIFFISFAKYDLNSFKAVLLLIQLRGGEIPFFFLLDDT